MGLITDIKIQPTGLSIAADDIIAQLKNIKDDNENAVFASVQRGLLYPPKDEPRKDTVPAARLWYEHIAHDMKNVQFYSQERLVQMGVYLYFYSFEKDSDGNPIDLQDFVDGVTTLTMNYLRKNTADPASIGFSPTYTVWTWEVPQTVVVDNPNMLRRYNNNVAMGPPWYVSRISFAIKVRNIQ